MEKRIKSPLSERSRATDLPADYIKQVKNLLTQNFEAPLKKYAKIKKKPFIQVAGKIYLDEIVLSIALCNEDQLSATSFHASVDFDPKASSPKAEQLLAICLDGLGGILDHYLNGDEKRLKQLASETLSDLEDGPFLWTAFQIDKRDVFIKIDKSNPKLDAVAEQWLQKNDPKYKELLEKEEKEVEDLFITGHKKPSDDDEDFH